MTTALVPITDMQRMAEAIAKSGLFGMKRTEEALALMIVAQAENRHPGSVAAEYHIIQGRPALKADAMLARFQTAGGKVAWADYLDDKVSAVFSHEAGGSVRIEWTIERAKKAGLTGKDNWTKYPRQMLRARVISEGVRTCYPAVAVGIYTPEEVADFDDKPAKRGRPAKDMGAAEVVDSDGVIHNEIPAPESPAAATPRQVPSPDPSSQGAGAEPETRDQTLTRLCAATSSNKIDLLAKAEVSHADEMGDDDWASCLRFLKKKQTSMADKVQA